MLYKLSLKTPMKIGKCTKPNCIVPTDSWLFMTHRTWQLFRPKGLERTPSNDIQWIAVVELLLSYPFQTYQTTLYYIHSWMFPSRWKSGYLSWLQLRFGSEGPEQAHFNLACPWLDSVRSWDCYAQRTRKWQDLKHKELATDTLRSPQAIGITKFQNLLMLYLSKPLSLLQALWHSTTTLNQNLLRLLRKQKVRQHPWLSPVSQGPIQENLKQLTGKHSRSFKLYMLSFSMSSMPLPSGDRSTRGSCRTPLTAFFWTNQIQSDASTTL